MLDTVRSSETSVNLYCTTQGYIPQYSGLHSYLCEYLKSSEFNLGSRQDII
jgi:hypothetical protein